MRVGVSELGVNSLRPSQDETSNGRLKTEKWGFKRASATRKTLSQTSALQFHVNGSNTSCPDSISITETFSSLKCIVKHSKFAT